MTDFAFVDRDFKKFPKLLLAEVPDFAAAQEFRELSSDEVSSPGLLTAAFTRYFARLLQEKCSIPRRLTPQVKIEKGFELIEKLAKSPDPEVENLAVVEVFENLNLSDPELGEFLRGLKPVSKALYERWLPEYPSSRKTMSPLAKLFHILSRLGCAAGVIP